MLRFTKDTLISWNEKLINQMELDNTITTKKADSLKLENTMNNNKNALERLNSYLIDKRLNLK